MIFVRCRLCLAGSHFGCRSLYGRLILSLYLQETFTSWKKDNELGADGYRRFAQPELPCSLLRNKSFNFLGLNVRKTWNLSIKHVWVTIKSSFRLCALAFILTLVATVFTNLFSVCNSSGLYFGASCATHWSRLSFLFDVRGVSIRSTINTYHLPEFRFLWNAG